MLRIDQSIHKKTLGAVKTAINCEHSCEVGPRSSSGPADDGDLFRYSDKDLSAKGKLHVIVFSDEHCDLKRVRKMLTNSKAGSGIDKELPLVNGFSAHIDPSEVEKILKQVPQNASVHINRLIAYPDPADLADILKDTPPLSATAPPMPASGGLDPSRAVIGIDKVWERGFTGKGVGVAVIDSGIHPHADLKDNIKGWVDIADGKLAPYDNFGHGTHVAGDIGGNGTKSAGRYRGIAPDADIIGVRITTVAEAIKGLQWCIDNKEKYNLKVINMSLGDFATKPFKDDPWAQACEKAIQAGLTVVVAAGNEGPDPGTVSTPGTDPRVITVGAIDDKHTVERNDDAMAGFSSRGPTSTDSLIKPDIVAPGVSIFSTLAPGATLDVPELPHIGKDYIAISGTSMATPIVSGVVATLLQANPNLTHDDVKKILEASADRYLPDGSNAQGYGLINAPRALDLALAMKDGAPAPVVPPLPVDAKPVAQPAMTVASAIGRAPTLNELRKNAPRHHSLTSSVNVDGFLLNVGRPVRHR